MGAGMSEIDEEVLEKIPRWFRIIHNGFKKRLTKKK